MKLVTVHWSAHGKPLCRLGTDYSVKALPPNTTTRAEEVTCLRCRAMLKRVAKKLAL